MKSITRMLLALIIFSLVSISSYHINTGQAAPPPDPESLMILNKKTGEVRERAKEILGLQSRLREAEATIQAYAAKPDPMVRKRSVCVKRS